MSKKLGFELLLNQLLEFIEGEAEWMIEDKEIGDSEIEKLLYLAIFFKIRFGNSEYTSLHVARTPEERAVLMAAPTTESLDLIICPQATIGDFRVDFLILAMDMQKNPGERPPEGRVWRKLVVECDGHQFHERTKEQAAKDRSRDRWLSSKNYDVFRFTGSEIWRDPWECADQILCWAVKSW
jgi:hypothetical protein